MNHKLINILVDFAFKKVFAGEGEKSKIILKDFLNSILELKDRNRIKEIIYLNPFNDRETERDKQSIMDIKVKTERDELIDIEVQINDVDDYKRRSLYYWCKLYGETLTKGKYYYDLKKSIVINILDFNLIKENDKFHNVFLIKEREDNFVFTDDLEIHYLELNKFKENKEVEKLNDLEEWITFLKECSPDGDMKVVDKLSQNKEEISVAVDIMNKLSADEMEYQRYLAREKYLMDEMSKKKYAEYKMNKVREELEAAEKERDRVKEEKSRVEEEKNRVKEEKSRVEEEKNKIEEEKNKIEEELKSVKKELVIAMIKNKLGSLSKEYEESISNVTMEQYEKILSNIFEIEKEQDLDKFL